MTCKVETDEKGSVVGFCCGPEPKPKDHVCDIKGPFKEVEFMDGVVNTATCSVCGRTAFQPWDIW